eukprot:14299687-Ditylum_brightwellii.AAC.1
MAPYFDFKDRDTGDAENSDCKDSGIGSALKMEALVAFALINLKWLSQMVSCFDHKDNDKENVDCKDSGTGCHITECTGQMGSN